MADGGAGGLACRLRSGVLSPLEEGLAAILITSLQCFAQVRRLLPPLLRRHRMALLTAPAVFAALLLFWAVLGGTDADYVLYKDAAKPVEDRVADLLGRMTLAEKIGQMTQIERLVATPDVLRDNFIGSLLSGGGSVPRKGATAKEWQDMVDGFQRACMSTRLAIPMIYGIDAVHGQNNVYGATIFPHNVGLGATRDPYLVKRIGEATALEVRATGIQYAFAPCIAVCRDPRWGRCYESYSEDRGIVQSMTELIPGLQGDVPKGFKSGMPFVAGKNKVAACAKHFVGDGGTVDGINENNTIINREGLMNIHMPAYQNAMDKGVSTVMISYSSWNGIKMHANHDLVTKYLKDTLKFQGFVISDWEGIDRITTPAGSDYSYSVKASILAGLDMIMVPNNYQQFISILTGHVNSGVINMSRIDDAVTRILRVKFTMGLFENPYADPAMAEQLGKQEHRDLAREAARKSLVLLKNGKTASDAPLLPLPKKAPKILMLVTARGDGQWLIDCGNSDVAGAGWDRDGVFMACGANGLYHSGSGARLHNIRLLHTTRYFYVHKHGFGRMRICTKATASRGLKSMYAMERIYWFDSIPPVFDIDDHDENELLFHVRKGGVGLTMSSVLVVSETKFLIQCGIIVLLNCNYSGDFSVITVLRV
ncbi:Lysosomal beta glucosidase [Triticum urartu]|uniref:Lysosomal beta glucosidase n=1 Tax=Triticum urartu TaxID=4572 RepID=M7ZZE1_TRIUA|nr:Lysosomal beta glucosidase [Triticum urartu]